MDHGDRLSVRYLSSHKPADADPADVFVVVNVADDRLQRSVQVALRRRDLGKNGIEQRGEVGTGNGGVVSCPALFRAGINHLEIKLIVVRAELDEKVDDSVDGGVEVAAFVDFVNANDGLFIERKRFFQYVARLRHAAFHRVDEKNHAVYHGEDPLYFAAEIGVSRGVDNVDFRVFVNNRSVLCEDGNSSFFFDIAAVHDSFRHDFVASENVILLQKPVDEGGFAVVDVRDDRDISYVASDIHMEFSYSNSFSIYFVARFVKQMEKYFLISAKKLDIFSLMC